MKKITSVLFLFYCFSVGWAQTVPPCTLEITDAETFARDWTVIDVNSDVSANTWAYNDGNAMYTQDKSNAADDWLIAPAVTLEAGKAYKVSAYVKHSSTFGSDKQKIELKIGTAPTVEGLTTRLVYDESFQSRLFVEKSGTFSPAESGVFYVGLRCYSESYNGDLYFQKIVIEEAPVYPAQITDLSIVAGERGAMSATLSWTWPSSDHLGGALSNLLGAKIYRGTDLVATLDTATVGGKAGWIDSSIETAGNYTYKVVAYNTFGDSQGSATTVTSPWIGNDTPAAVTDLVALAEDATVSLSLRHRQSERTVDISIPRRLRMKSAVPRVVSCPKVFRDHSLISMKSRNWAVMFIRSSQCSMVKRAYRSLPIRLLPEERKNYRIARVSIPNHRSICLLY